MLLAPDSLIHDRYRLEQPLGRGAVGAVYRATDQQGGQRVALKHVALRGAQRHPALQEAARLALLSHPVLPRIIEYFATSEGVFVVSELVEGESLGQQSGALSLTGLLAVADSLLEVLGLLHGQKPPLIHRDIKPQNLRWGADGQVRLLDFGLGRGAQPNPVLSAQGRPPGHLAPEVLQGQGSDPRDDLYSLGATLYFLATGEPPTDALSRTTALMQRQRDPLRPAHLLNPRVPPAVSALLGQALALNRQSRPESAVAFRTRLSQAHKPSIKDPGAPMIATIQPPWRTMTARLLKPLVRRTVQLWEGDGVYQGTLKGHVQPVTALAWSPDGQLLASASEDSSVRLWEADGNLRARCLGHQRAVQALAWSPNGWTLASRAADSSVRLWGPQGEEIACLRAHQGEISALAWSPNGRYLATAGVDHRLHLWRADGSHRLLLGELESPLRALAWHPSGRILASADEVVRLWDLEGAPLATLEGHAYLVHTLAWSPDGQFLASASADQTICLWRADSQAPHGRLSGHPKPIHVLAWRPDSKMLAALSWDDNRLWLWKPDGNLHSTLVGHESWTHTLAWRPDGGLLASGAADRSVRLWESNGALRLTLRGHQAGIYALAWRPDGQALASASADHTVRLWQGDPISGEAQRLYE